MTNDSHQFSKSIWHSKFTNKDLRKNPNYWPKTKKINKMP